MCVYVLVVGVVVIQEWWRLIFYRGKRGRDDEIVGSVSCVALQTLGKNRAEKIIRIDLNRIYTLSTETLPHPLHRYLVLF